MFKRFDLIQIKLGVKQKMSAEPLLPPTCYICLEECNTTSPCKCEAPVHHKCLWEYNRKSGAENCTICRGEFEQVFNPCLLIVGLISLSVFYIVGGFLGEFVWSIMGMCDCAHVKQSWPDVIFSQSFALSSLSVASATGVCISAIRHARNPILEI